MCHHVHHRGISSFHAYLLTTNPSYSTHRTAHPAHYEETWINRGGQNEVNPRSVLSNFWGSLQNTRFN